MFSLNSFSRVPLEFLEQVVSEIRGGGGEIAPPSGARYKNTPVERGLTVFEIFTLHIVVVLTCRFYKVFETSIAPGPNSDSGLQLDWTWIRISGSGIWTGLDLFNSIQFILYTQG